MDLRPNISDRLKAPGFEGSEEVQHRKPNLQSTSGPGVKGLNLGLYWLLPELAFLALVPGRSALAVALMLLYTDFIRTARTG